jgi:hypothetical protein
MTDMIHPAFGFIIILIVACQVLGMAGSTIEDMARDLMRRLRGLA